MTQRKDPLGVAARVGCLHCERALSVLALERSASAAAIADALTAARDALQPLEHRTRDFSGDTRVNVEAARVRCEQQLTRNSPEVPPSIRPALEAALASLKVFANLMHVAANLGTAGRHTSTGPGRSGGRNRGPYRHAKQRR